MMGGHVRQTSLELHKNFTNLQVSVNSDSVLENSTLEIECSFEGGYPTPQIIFMLIDAGNHSKEGSKDRFIDVKSTTDGSRLIYRAKYTPAIEDNDLYIGCRAEQFGLKNETLNVQTKVNNRIGWLFI